MSAVATAIVGATVVSSVMSSKASDKAADAQVESSQAANDTQLTMFREGNELTAPWRKAGKRALAKLEKKVYAGPGKFTKSPGYQFRLDEANKAIERSAAARGGLVSGRTGKELTRYSQNYATNDYDNFLNRYYQSLTPLQSLAGVGQTTASNQAAQGNQVASNVANNQMEAGNARASGYINSANAWTGALQGGLNTIGTIYGSKDGGFD